MCRPHRRRWCSHCTGDGRELTPEQHPAAAPRGRLPPLLLSPPADRCHLYGPGGAGGPGGVALRLAHRCRQRRPPTHPTRPPRGLPPFALLLPPTPARGGQARRPPHRRRRGRGLSTQLRPRRRRLLRRRCWPLLRRRPHQRGRARAQRRGRVQAGPAPRPQVGGEGGWGYRAPAAWGRWVWLTRGTHYGCPCPWA